MIERASVLPPSLPPRENAPITATVERFSELSGLGKTSIKELIKSGALRSVKIMGRRLVIVDSYYDLVRQAEMAE